MVTEGLFNNEFINFGVLGLWTAFNIYQMVRMERKLDKKEEDFRLREEKIQDKFAQIVENNTVALNKVNEVCVQVNENVNFCKYNSKKK